MSEQRSANPTFPIGGGGMGQMIREKDWSKTSLGDSSLWQQSFKTTLNILLNSKFTKFLWWGPELLCFYHDAYIPSLGQDGNTHLFLVCLERKHGQKSWILLNHSWIRSLKEENLFIYEDLLVPINRNGSIEDAYGTFSYSHAWDDS